ncbi:hypothetical protein GGR50DRAFT_664417 [Xylaria sp. CBS 124048]|nr:hypothetical protein GGR50DRAFT_664417 [Xylaria sp. CBS 124048]
MAVLEDPTTRQSSTPHVKFEPSPAESFLSTSTDLYPSLFAAASATPPPTLELADSMTPESFVTDENTSNSSPTPDPISVEAEKKPTKKRKSWGQILPEPKTNLPPRKRAKTEDEKEQRRVERVLRNRRAAQSSRERKRQEVEALEQRNAALEAALLDMQKKSMALMEELSQLRRTTGVSRSTSPLHTFQPSPLTLSQPLFSQSADGVPQHPSGTMEDFILMTEQDGTVDPASISPELSPVADSDIKSASTLAVKTEPATGLSTPPSDETQHPAAVLCDQQCPSVDVPPFWLSQNQQNPFQTFLMVSSVLISVCQQPLKLIAGALKTNLALCPTPSILSTIIWLVTRPPNFPSSTSISSSVMKSAAHLPRRWSTTPSLKNPTPLSACSTLRIRSLRKLLTSSPILARPLMDATMGFLRLVSEGRDGQVDNLASGFPGIKGDESFGPLMWPEGASLPSQEVLLTLLWVLIVEERKTSSQKTSMVLPRSRPGSNVLRERHQRNKSVYLKGA